MEDKILTLHPDTDKSGRTIDTVKYERVKHTMIAALKRKALTNSELMEEMKRRLKGFSGSILWYAETVKLDLLARKVIERRTDKPVRYALL